MLTPQWVTLEQVQDARVEGSSSTGGVRIAVNPQYGRFMEPDSHMHTGLADDGYQRPRHIAVSTALCDSGAYSEIRTNEPVYATIT